MSSTSTGEAAVTLTSIPLCDATASPSQPGPSYSDDVIVRIGDAMDATEQRYGSSSTFAPVGWQTVADAPQIVVALTDEWGLGAEVDR